MNNDNDNNNNFLDEMENNQISDSRKLYYKKHRLIYK